MKKTFVFSIILSLSLINSTIIAFASLVEQTPEELQEKSDVVLIGTIAKASGRTFERVTDYTISVEKYLKNDLNQQTLQITSGGCRNCSMQVEDEPIFDTGDRVLLYLNSNGNTYQISPYSTVLVDDTGYAELSKKLEDAAFYGKLIPQLIIVGTAGSAVAITGIIVYRKTRRKRK